MNETLKKQRERAIILLRRAQDNKVLATTPTQLDIASYQYTRVLRILQRINNAIKLERETKADQQWNTRRTRTVRVKHPITHRYVKVTQEKADEWQRQYP